MTKFVRLYIVPLVILIAFLGGCIENDIPYPRIVADIIAFEVSGQKSAANINAAERTVVVDMADTADLSKIKVLKFEVSNDAVVSPEIPQQLDLTSSKVYTLSTYQDYYWTISATQDMGRFISVENQVGAAIFDEFTKIALVTVGENSMLSKIKVTGMKLGPEGSVITPDFTTITDFTTTQKFTWTYKNRSEEWSIKVVKSDVSVTTSQVSAYAKYVIAKGEFPAGSGSPTFAYKKKTDEQWSVYNGEVEVIGGSFSAKVTGLEPSTTYIIKSKVGELYGPEVEFETESILQIENSNFENWIKEGKSWFPNLDLSDAHYWWDSGNKGANTMGEKNPTVAEETIVVSGKAAKLSSTSIVGVFAAGNIYTGKYVKTAGVGAQLDFGIPFTSRPTSLKGYYNYNPGKIDKVKEKYAHLAGQNDTCHIYIALADWDKPFEINTTKEIFLDVKNDKHIIAYGELIDGTGTNGEYKEFEIPFVYRYNNRKPKYILVVAAASKYGDYFTGSTSSVLYLDEFTLSYD